jgi:hypothetical protein
MANGKASASVADASRATFGAGPADAAWCAIPVGTFTMGNEGADAVPGAMTKARPLR